MSTLDRTLPGWLATLGLLAAIPGSSVRAEEQAPATRIFAAATPPPRAGYQGPPAPAIFFRVWSPGRQHWSLTADGQTVVLTAKTEGDDFSPRWQTVGAAELQADPPSRSRRPARGGQTKPAAKERRGRTRRRPHRVAVPALLVLTTDPNFDPGPALDLIRGRIDTAEPSPDPRRTGVRSNQEGADFRAPGSPQEWRDRSRRSASSCS